MRPGRVLGGAANLGTSRPFHPPSHPGGHMWVFGDSDLGHPGLASLLHLLLVRIPRPDGQGFFASSLAAPRTSSRASSTSASVGGRP